MAATLTSTSHGQTLVLTWSNPAFRNALGPEIYAGALEALNAAERSQDIRSVVFTGEGSVFCAGGNLQRLQGNRALAPQVQADSIEGMHDWVEAIRNFPKPVIAAVEGAAAGAGFSIALACDFIVAASDAFFAMSYGRVGLSPDGGASYHLLHTLPRQLATELLICGERIDAPRLKELGLVNQVCVPGQALSAALALSARLNAMAPNVLATNKELINSALQSSLNTQLAAERDHFVRNLHHANAGIGIDAFLSKQTPKFV